MKLFVKKGIDKRSLLCYTQYVKEIEAHCTISIARKNGRQGRAKKAWVPKRMRWQASWLAARRISVLLSQTSVAKGYPRHKKEGAGSLYVALGGLHSGMRDCLFSFIL